MLIRQATCKIFFDIVGQIIIFIYISFLEIILIENLWIHILNQVDEDVKKEGIIKQNDTEVRLDMSRKMLLKISDFTVKLSIL